MVWLFITCHFVFLLRKKYPACRKAIVSAQTLNCLEHCEQAKPTSWHMPCSTPGQWSSLEISPHRIQSILITLPAFWPKYILCCPWSCLILLTLRQNLKERMLLAFHKRKFSHKKNNFWERKIHIN